MKALIVILVLFSSQVLAAKLNYVAQVTSTNVDGSERTRLFLTTQKKCQKHLSQIVYQAESTVGVTKTFGAKCGNASYLMGFFKGLDMNVPYILSSNGKDVIILNRASYQACMGMAQLLRNAGVSDAICID